MDKFWSWFWKFFGAACGGAFVVSIIWGIAHHSGAVTYAAVQKIIALGLGICGIIGIVVVPMDLYFRDRADSMKNNTAAAGNIRRETASGDEYAAG
ncbi:MAG: hypothetical protein LBG25_02865 [Spirochaetaceae bacterium]|jgi:hypothetical protein|nr:hypothetical protein [Spirochaetaceae bacterium]